jgi:hypothetical protein
MDNFSSLYASIYFIFKWVTYVSKTFIGTYQHGSCFEDLVVTSLIVKIDPTCYGLNNS